MIREETSRMRIGVVLCCLVALCLAGCASARGVGQDSQVCGRSSTEKIEK